jgi:hypothetical protein
MCRGRVVKRYLEGVDEAVEMQKVGDDKRDDGVKDGDEDDDDSDDEISPKPHSSSN